ncbi:hypothetical protein NKG05_16895 [Oerskovia sp. M15]
MGDLNAAYLEGHEIGTHYNGHFCADNPPGGGDWTTADWNSELDQFFGFWNDWQEINGLQGSPRSRSRPPRSRAVGRRASRATGTRSPRRGPRTGRRTIRRSPAAASRGPSRSTASGSFACRRRALRRSAPSWPWTTTSGTSSTRRRTSRNAP